MAPILLFLFLLTVSSHVAPLHTHSRTVDKVYNDAKFRRYIVTVNNRAPAFERDISRVKGFLSVQFPGVDSTQVDNVYEIGDFRAFSIWLTESTLRTVRSHLSIERVEEDSFSSIFPIQRGELFQMNADPIVPEDSDVWLGRPDWGQIRVDETFRDLTTNPAGLFDGGNYADPWDQNWSWNGPKLSVPNTGSAAVVWVLDTGVFPDHQEFSNDGKASRVTQLVNFAFNDPGSLGDCNGHGTFVAGSVGGFNRGVAKEVEIRSVRVLDCTGEGYNSVVIQGVDYIAANPAAGRVNIVSASLGSFASTSMDDAFNAAVAKGIIAVVAAGNSEKDACSSSTGNSPARAANVTAIAASDGSDYIAYFTNFGSCIKAFSPGLNIVAPWIDPDGLGQKNYYSQVTGIYAPFATGAVAVYATFPDVDDSPAGVNQAIINRSPSGIIKGLTGARASTPNRLICDKWTPQ